MTAPNNGGGSRGTNAKIAPEIGHDRGEIGSTIVSRLGAGEAQPQEVAPVVLDPNDPLPSAQKFIAANYLREGVRTLHHLSGDFYSWTGTCYRVIDAAAVRAQMYRFAEKARVLVIDSKTGNPLLEEFKPTSAKINNIIDALKAEANLPSTVKPPTWLDDTSNLPTNEIIACGDGLLHIFIRRLMRTNHEYLSRPI